MSQLAQMVRAKHPGAYDDLDDQALDRMVRAKYPGAYDDIPGPDQAGSGPVSRFVSGAWEMLNPVPMVEAALSPIETGKALLGAQEQTALKGLQAEQEGRGAAAVAYKLASGVPILGPLAAGIAERASDGDLAGAAGNVAGIVAAPGAYLKAGKLAAKGAAAAGPAAQRVAASAGSVGQAIRHPIEYAKANPNAAGMAAGALTELAIGNLGAAVATGFGARMATRWLAGQAAAKAKNAIKSSMNGQGMSGAQAENVIIKMSPEEFVDAAKRAGVEVAVPPEAIVMAPSPRATTLGAGRAPVQPPQAPPMSGSGMPVAVEPSRLDSVGLSRASSSLPQGSIAPPMGSSGFRVARAAQAAPEPPPVAPGMAQDLVPDQLAPEISPAAPEMPVAPPAQAGGVSIPTPAVTVAEDQAARLARQKQHIADSYAAKEAKAAENLAAGETMEADLVASIERMKASPKKPGESLAQWKARIESESGATIEVPAEAMEAAEMIRARVERMQDSGLSKAQAADEVLGNILPKARPVDVQEMVNDIYSARAVKQAEAPPVVKAEAPPAPSPAKPADVPVHPNDTHQYGARQYTHEGAQAQIGRAHV